MESTRNWVRKSNQNRVSNWTPERSMQMRYQDAEDIYKTLNGLWQSKGFLGDSNWAFVKGKKMERKSMWRQMRFEDIPTLERTNLLLKVAWNLFTDWMFGYGESLGRMLMSYTFTILLFAFFYYSYPELNVKNFLLALEYSAKSMLAMTPDEIKEVSPTIDFLNVIQTSIGILITGIFGFILGNKIRNQ